MNWIVRALRKRKGGVVFSDDPRSAAALSKPDTTKDGSVPLAHSSTSNNDELVLSEELSLGSPGEIQGCQEACVRAPAVRELTLDMAACSGCFCGGKGEENAGL